MKAVIIGVGLSGLVAARELGRRRFGELGAETMYAAHEYVMALSRRLELDTVACGYFDPAAPPMRFAGRVLPVPERRSIAGWLPDADVANPPHQGGDGAGVASIVGGDSEPGVLDESAFKAVDESVSALAAASVTRVGQPARIRRPSNTPTVRGKRSDRG